MAASTKHVLTNVERMAKDSELIRLWNHHAQTKNDDGTERTIQQAWAAFVVAAHAAKIADRIPGTVGRTFKAKYAAEPPTVVEVDAIKVAETRRVTVRPSAKRTAAKRTPAARTSKAAGK